MPDILGALELPGSVMLMAAGSEGIGTDANAGTGKGGGPEGPGSGLREGAGAGAGDGPFVDGTPGLTSPRVVFENKPAYTNEAMRARIQGAVLIEAVVREDGTVGAVKVVRSLDAAFGLDREAVKAVRAWRFQPGTYEGRPVPVRVLIELFFTLR